MRTASRARGNGRERAATTSVALIERSTVLIAELISDLDVGLRREQRPNERLRILREAANRITRTANDATEAYRSANRAINAALARSNGDVAAVEEVRARLGAARVELLGVLDVAGRRYPPPNSGATGRSLSPREVTLPRPAATSVGGSRERSRA